MTKRYFLISMLLISIITVVVSILQYNKGAHTFSSGTYTSINNYHIFKHSFYNLLDGADLYAVHPEIHHDLYKYSPLFALSMGFLAWMPNVIGFSIWNLLNALILIFFWWKLPLQMRQKWWGAFLLLPELIISLQNGQSNGLITASILGAWVFYERKKQGLAALWIHVGVFTKLFAIAGAAFAIFHPQKLKAVGLGFIIGIIFMILPALVTGPAALADLYESWWNMLKQDSPGPHPISVPGAAEKIFESTTAIRISQIAGLVMLFIPLLKTSMYPHRKFRLYYLSLVLLWVVLWNHKAESPTYIMAVTGAVLWYFMQPAAIWRTGILILVIVFTSLSQSDLFPANMREQVFQPFLIKMIPCLIVFMVAWIEMLNFRPLDTAQLDKEMHPMH